MKRFLYIFLAVDLVLINLFAAYLVYERYFGNESVEQSQEINIASNLNRTESLECPESCVSLINDLRQGTESEETNLTITPTTSNRLAAPTVQKTKSTSYVPIPGSGSTVNTQWTDLFGTDFYLTTADYPGLVGVYFEANMRLENGNGEAFVRLYDVTNSRGVDGSELSTQSQSSVFVSNGPLSMWAGNNLYRIQARSLTADTTHFESGRLKIISEN